VALGKQHKSNYLAVLHNHKLSPLIHNAATNQQLLTQTLDCILVTRAAQHPQHAPPPPLDAQVVRADRAGCGVTNRGGGYINWSEDPLLLDLMLSVQLPLRLLLLLHDWPVQLLHDWPVRLLLQLRLLHRSRHLLLCVLPVPPAVPAAPLPQSGERGGAQLRAVLSALHLLLKALTGDRVHDQVVRPRQHPHKQRRAQQRQPQLPGEGVEGAEQLSGGACVVDEDHDPGLVDRAAGLVEGVLFDVQGHADAHDAGAIGRGQVGLHLCAFLWFG